MGADLIEERMEALAQAEKADGSPVNWICDPMHGNTITSENGYKTRRFADILA